VSNEGQHQVPEGYKQTEVGVIPKDWLIEKLGGHASFRTGPFGSALHQTDYVDGGVPVINPMQIIDGKIIPTSSMSITESVARRLSDFRLVQNEIVIGRRGDMGRCAVVQESQSGWLCGTGSMIVRCKTSLESNFAQRLLSSPQLITEIENTSVGTTMVNLNQGTLKNLMIPLPPSKEEQTAIANALSDVDGLIGSLEKLIAKKRAIKTAAMQQLLTGKTRLPPFDQTHTSYKQTDLGEIPNDWEIKWLGDLLEKIMGGGTPRRSNSVYWGGHIPWVTVKDFATFNPISSQEYITNQGLLSSSSNLIPAGILITSTRMALGKAVIYDVPVAINQDLKALFPNKLVDTNFLYYWFEDNAKTIDELGSGSTVKGLSLPDLKSIKFRLPSMKEQSAIVNVLSDMDKDIEALEQCLTKTQQLKQGMMQELLTGRTRLV